MTETVRPTEHGLRVVYIHQYYRNRGMWGGTRSYELARRLVADGYEVHVVTTDCDASRPSLRWRVTEESGIHVHWLPVPYSNNMPYSRRILSFAQFALLACARATRLSPSVVLATSTPLTVSVPGMIASRLRRVPFVFEVRDLWPELPIDMGALRSPAAKKLAVGLARLTYRNADRVVALSPGMAAGVAAHGYPADRITVIPNGCDLDLFEADSSPLADFRTHYPWLQDRPLVVYAGTLGPINGVDYLVRLAAEVLERDGDVRFLILGEGKDGRRVTKLARDLGVLERNLWIRPPVAKAQLPAVLSAATIATSVFLPIPRMWDNSANKFFDALAAGRPIAINYDGWQGELLRRTGAGVVLPHDDLPSAAGLLISHVRDPAWLEAAAAASRQLARDEFSRDELFSRFEKVLRDAVRSTSDGRERTARSAGVETADRATLSGVA